MENIELEFNNDALKFQVLEELPQQIKEYLNKFEIREIYNFFMIILWLFTMVLYYSPHDILKRKINTCSIILRFCANFTNVFRFLVWLPTQHSLLSKLKNSHL